MSVDYKILRKAALNGVGLFLIVWCVPALLLIGVTHFTGMFGGTFLLIYLKGTCNVSFFCREVFAIPISPLSPAPSLDDYPIMLLELSFVAAIFSVGLQYLKLDKKFLSLICFALIAFWAGLLVTT